MNLNEYFARFRSASIAGSANQYHFKADGATPRTGRVFFRIDRAGEHHYSLLFSNSVDSTFSDGAFSRRGMLCDPWQILSCRIGVCRRIPEGKVEEMTVGDEAEKYDIVTEAWQKVRFDGKEQKDVAPGEFFTTDPIPLSFRKGEYLCLEMTYLGTDLPCHQQTLMPIYNKTDAGFVYDVQMPVPSMIGCDAPVAKRVVFWGDSITQGIGTPNNAYAHWNAFLTEMLPEENSYWNLGLGWGRADDAASEGSWFYKAKQADYVAICFGVNDILQGYTASQLKDNLLRTVRALKNAGVKVFVQTPPPFNYIFSHHAVWQETVRFILEELKDVADAVFDTTPVLGKGPEFPQKARYCDHPNAEGCKIWAEALEAPFRAFLEK